MWQWPVPSLKDSLRVALESLHLWSMNTLQMPLQCASITDNLAPQSGGWGVTLYPMLLLQWVQ